MDKRKVITAYQCGFITLQECAQILGLSSTHMIGLLNDGTPENPKRMIQRQPVNP